MKTEKIDKRLLVLALVSGIFFAFSLIFSEKTSKSPRAEKSALLNPKYAEEISTIGIVEKNSRLELFESANFWYASKDGKIALADKKLCENFIEKMSGVRKLYEVSKNAKDFKNLGVSGDESSRTVEFSVKGENLPFLFFGIDDALTSRIAVRSDISEVAYECMNDFSQFLTSSLEYWCAGEIFGEIESPQVAKFVFGEKTVSLNSSDKDFGHLSHFLLTLRHGSLFENPPESAEKVAEIELHGGNGRISIASIFSSGGEYFVRKTSFPAILENSAFEISEWTFNKIKEEFGI